MPGISLSTAGRDGLAGVAWVRIVRPGCVIADRWRRIFTGTHVARWGIHISRRRIAGLAVGPRGTLAGSVRGRHRLFLWVSRPGINGHRVPIWLAIHPVLCVTSLVTGVNARVAGGWIISCSGLWHDGCTMRSVVRTAAGADVLARGIRRLELWRVPHPYADSGRRRCILRRRSSILCITVIRYCAPRSAPLAREHRTGKAISTSSVCYLPLLPPPGGVVLQILNHGLWYGQRCASRGARSALLTDVKVRYARIQ